jgi:hypothetical protein
MKEQTYSTYIICMYENRIRKSIKMAIKIGRGFRGGEFDQSTLYAFMKILQ